MMGVPPGARIWLACGVTDLRRGFDGLAGCKRNWRPTPMRVIFLRSAAGAAIV
jgi:hypothetical protein